MNDEMKMMIDAAKRHLTGSQRAELDELLAEATGSARRRRALLEEARTSQDPVIQACAPILHAMNAAIDGATPEAAARRAETEAAHAASSALATDRKAVGDALAKLKADTAIHTGTTPQSRAAAEAVRAIILETQRGLNNESKSLKTQRRAAAARAEGGETVVERASAAEELAILDRLIAAASI